MSETIAELFGTDALIDTSDLSKVAVRMAFNLLFVWIVIRLVYIRLHGRRDFAFSCVMLNVITFAICVLLRKVPVEMGFALGLFAVFGILRYRTESIAVRDLTYLFIVLGIGILNAVANKKISVAEVAFMNSAIVGLTVLLEYAPFSQKQESRLVIYDRLELLKPERGSELLADLRDRMGLDVIDCRAGDIDLLRDTATLVVTSVGRSKRTPWLGSGVRSRTMASSKEAEPSGGGSRVVAMRGPERVPVPRANTSTHTHPSGMDNPNAGVKANTSATENTTTNTAKGAVPKTSSANTALGAAAHATATPRRPMDASASLAPSEPRHLSGAQGDPK